MTYSFQKLERPSRECCAHLPSIYSYWKEIIDGMDGKFWDLRCPVCHLMTEPHKTRKAAVEAWDAGEVC